VRPWHRNSCLGYRIHSPPVKAVSEDISEWAASQFSLTPYESTGAVCPDESLHYLWKQFQELFLWGRRLSFWWLFTSQKGLCGQTKPFIPWDSSFGGYIWMGNESVFLHCLWVKRGCRGWRIHSAHVKRFLRVLLSGQWLCFSRLFMSHHGLFGLSNPFATCESSFAGNIWMGSESVFLDCLWVNRGCGGWRIHSAHVKRVLRALSEWAATQFS